MMAALVITTVTLLRLMELLWARRNTRHLRARGAVEVGRGHYPLFVILHAFWLASMAWLVPPSHPGNAVLLGVFAGLQILRLWVILTLGPFWTTRIITLPGAPLVARGPYRFMRHPNYLVVCAEIAVLPLAFGAWEIALIFSLLNGVLLLWRIRLEEQALAIRRGTQRSWKEDASAT